MPPRASRSLAGGQAQEGRELPPRSHCAHLEGLFSSAGQCAVLEVSQTAQSFVVVRRKFRARVGGEVERSEASLLGEVGIFVQAEGVDPLETMEVVRLALTGLTGSFFALVGSVKCAGGAILPPVFAMQFEAISTRYQPALAAIPFLPGPVSSWLRDVPTKDFMLCIGVPELSFGLMTFLHLGGLIGRRAERAANAAMVVFMAGPLASHWLGDDWTLPLDSNVGPTGIVPAAVVTLLLVARLLLSGGASGNTSGKGRKIA